MSNITNLVHIAIFFPLFYYVYYSRDSLSKEVKYLLLLLAAVGILFHLYKVTNVEKMRWVYLIHLIAVFPILLYIGLSEKTPRYIFELLLIIAFGMLGYHSYNLVNYGILNK